MTDESTQDGPRAPSGELAYPPKSEYRSNYGMIAHRISDLLKDMSPDTMTKWGARSDREHIAMLEAQGIVFQGCFQMLVGALMMLDQGTVPSALPVGVVPREADKPEFGMALRLIDFPAEAQERTAVEIGYCCSITLGDSRAVWWSTQNEEQRSHWRRVATNVLKELDALVNQK